MAETSEKTLREIWEEISRPFFASNGADAKFPYDLAGNAELTKTLQALSEQYLPKCEDKFLLLHKKRELEKALLGSGDYDLDEISECFNGVESEIEKFDAQLVQINASALRAIMDSPGFPQVADAERSKTAVALLSPVIKYAVSAACLHSGYIVDIKDDPRLIAAVKTIVPKSFGGRI